MGAIKLFSSDSRDHAGDVVYINSTPDPMRFRIINLKIINNYPVLLVEYPDVTNYEGLKLLMYGKNFDLSLLSGRIDPHFFTFGDSPIARFEPTPYGKKLAEILAKNLP